MRSVETTTMRNPVPESSRGRALFALAHLGLLAACSSSPWAPYYPDDGAAPTITSVSPDALAGNVGGDVVTISGSNFGLEPNAITVVFGNSNARILSISDTELQVEVPRGPLAGGAVDVKVGTPEGQARSSGGFTYEVNRDLDNELAYIAVTNDYWSCYAGIGSGIASFCNQFAYSGQAGLDGYGEFLEFAFPRLHTAYLGQKGGFAGNHDESPGRWIVENPPHDMNTFDLETLYEDRRIDIGEFALRNPELRGDFCVDETLFSTWTWPGGMGTDAESGETRYFPPTGISPSGDLRESKANGNGGCQTRSIEYDNNEVRFCQVVDYDEPYKYAYEADWPSGTYFFTNDREETDPEDMGPVDVQLIVPKISSGVLATLTLPEYSVFSAYRGDALGGDAQTPFFLETSCDDTNGDGAFDLTDSVVRWEWTPTAFEQPLVDSGDAQMGDVTSVRTYVRATVTLFTLGWLGGEGAPLRATITVPDDHNYDEDLGTSSLELPASVLYQFPSTFVDLGLPQSSLGGTSTNMQWGKLSRSDYGYVVASAERVTEYTVRIELQDEDVVRTGDLVFAYSTGDMGLVEFSNPLDQDTCGNCLDDDGDGWIDDQDPDCTEDRPGQGAFPAEDRFAEGRYSCNDGLDNDADGLTDAEDPDCASGSDGETNCFDGEDNDGDGFIDEVDADCAPGGSGIEDAEPDDNGNCVDEGDNDGDGWIDFDDPDCENAADNEAGLTGVQCNDGVDNDGHGDIDAADPFCQRRGATYDAEQPNLVGDCADGTDNDADGYVDGNDPDCENPPFALEDEDFDSSEGAPACYNGADDDGDGYVDSLDPGCVSATSGEADGFVSDEDAANPGFTACEDGADNDGDGWTDAADPDCAAGVAEIGFGATQCNDGDDNDGDTLADAADPECADAADDDESQ